MHRTSPRRMVVAPFLVLLALIEPCRSRAEERPANSPSAVEVTAAMKRAAIFFRDEVARHGGYVYLTTTDFRKRFGEGAASEDQIWVQPPGTPTVGMAYLTAHEATGDSFYLEAATEAAEALLHGQLESGGWTYAIDFDPQGARAARYRNGQGKRRGKNNSTLDDDKSQSALRLLMRVDQAHEFQHAAIHEAVVIGLDALLRAQFANGAFPQVWEGPAPQDLPTLSASLPTYDWRTEGRIKEYWDLYTLNDNLAGSVSRTLNEAHQIYGDQRYLDALRRFGNFLLLAQLPEPQPGWAQQYNYQMHPVWARKFEPPAITGSESQDVLETLLTIYEQTGDEKYLAPIPRAIAYFRRSLLPDGRLARFYELGSNRPLYMFRRGDVYTLTYDDGDAPSHYGWKVGSRLDRIERRYERLRQTTEQDLRPADAPSNPAGEGDSSSAAADEQPRARCVARLAPRVRQALASLDAQGRWVSTSTGAKLPGATKLPAGEQYLSSAVFSKNLELLSEYLQCLSDP